MKNERKISSFDNVQSICTKSSTAKVSVYHVRDPFGWWAPSSAPAVTLQRRALWSRSAVPADNGHQRGQSPRPAAVDFERRQRRASSGGGRTAPPDRCSKAEVGAATRNCCTGQRTGWCRAVSPRGRPPQMAKGALGSSEWRTSARRPAENSDGGCLFALDAPFWRPFLAGCFPDRGQRGAAVWWTARKWRPSKGLRWGDGLRAGWQRRRQNRWWQRDWPARKKRCWRGESERLR